MRWRVLSSEYFDYLAAEIVAESQVTGEPARGVFVEKVISIFADSGTTQDMTLTLLETVGKQNRVIRLDAFAFDELDSSFHAIVADYRNTLETLSKADLTKLFSSLENFVKASLSIDEIGYIPDTSDAIIAATKLNSSWKNLSNIKFYVVSNAALSSRVRDLEPTDLNGIRVDYQVWDLNRITELSESQAGRSDLVVDLVDFNSESVPALRALSHSEEFATYLFALSGQTLARIFDQYGSRLLEGNVRSFLSARGKINAGIRETVLQTPQRFLAYNNGITATASSLEAIESDSIMKICSIRDLQIVNGGQTTATLWNVLRTGGERAALLSQVEVQVKLIVIPNELDSDLIPRVAQYANSQNKVQDSDLASNSNFNRRLDELSKLIYAPPQAGSQVQTHWYFERARGAYLNERNKIRTGAQQNQFDRQNPKSQVFSKVQLAKYYSAWNLKPQMASRGDQKNFDSFTKEVASKYAQSEKLIEIDESYFKQIVGQKIIFDTLRGEIPKSDWYETGGYLANCTIYGISKFHHEIQRLGMEIDWQLVWRNQSLSAEMLLSLVECAKAAHDVLFSPSRTQQNISEWAKTDACWQALINQDTKATFDFAELKMASDDKTETRRTQRANSKALAEVAVVTYFASLVSDDWYSVINELGGSMSGLEVQLARSLMSSPSQFLQPKQREMAISILRRARAQGVRIPEFPF